MAQKTSEEWRKESESRLTPEEREVIWDKGTESRNKGYTNYLPKTGHFACKVCETPLYSWSSKFHSGCGWPAFDKFYQGSVATFVDNSFGMERTEITCGTCGGHLGHVFHGEEMTATNERHCVNSISVVYIDKAVDLPEGTVK